MGQTSTHLRSTHDLETSTQQQHGSTIVPTTSHNRIPPPPPPPLPRNLPKQHGITIFPTTKYNRFKPLPPPPPLPPRPLPPPRPPPPPPSLPQKLPFPDLLGNREKYINICVPLYEAASNGDWLAANAIFGKQPELVYYAITENYDTILHVAASAQYTKRMEDFVQNLVDFMAMKGLELQNKNNNTALFLAAAEGSVKIADILVKKNNALLGIPGSQGWMPLYVAALSGKHDMVRYLYDNSDKMTGVFWTKQSRGEVVLECVEAHFFDVALQIVTDDPELASNGDVLRVLARKPDAFNRKRNVTWRIINSRPDYRDCPALELLGIIWGKIKQLPKSEIDYILRGPPDTIGPNSSQRYSSRILFVAAEMGNTRFIVELIQAYPDLIWRVDDHNRSIFHIAIMHRHHGIYKLLYGIGSMKSLITRLEDESGNNMLHLVGMTSKQMRPQTSRASLLMQRELLWFKEVKKMMPPSYRERKNNAGETPYAIFSENNKDLVSEGLSWMKDCMVVATLIVTVAFAVAFTVPGGYIENNGIPMFIHERIFLVFAIADAISLFTSSASLLVFLSILTSRHDEHDFLGSLPKKILIGLVTLFVSVTAMMITFGASFFVLYHNGLKWVPILINVCAAMPILLFAKLQGPMLVDMFRSSFDSSYLFKPKRRMLYNPNPRF